MYFFHFYQLIKKYIQLGFDLNFNLYTKFKRIFSSFSDFKSMFKRLFAYIRGANEDKRKIRMTAPVVVSMWYNISNHKTWSNMRFWSSSRRRGPWSEQSEACEACTDENAGSIECPHHCGPPKPTDPKVKISRTPQVCLYVR